MSFMDVENNIHIGWDAALVLAVVCAVGFAVWYIFFRRKRLTLEGILEMIFGKSLYAVSFSLNDVRNWINARKDKLDAEHKALIMKINSHTMKPFADKLSRSGIDIDDAEQGKFLVIMIVDVAANIVNMSDMKEMKKCLIDSFLVKYYGLSDELEKLLSEHNGVFRVRA